MYEKVSYGDTLVQPFDTTAEQKKWLWELLKPRYLGDTIFEFINEENFGLFFKEECLLPGKTLAGAHAAIHTGLSGLATGLVDSVAAHFDLSCVGIAIYDTSFFDWDTSSFTCGIRYKRLIRSEAYLYGSSRLGMDTEEQVIGDSLEKYKAVYNPLCHQWQYLHSLGTFDQIFASLDTSKIRYNEVGWKRYEFGNHLGNVLAVISDRKLLKDTLGGYFFTDLYSVQDYDPFGMVQPGRNWKRKDYRFHFNGKEQESTPWLDYGFRNYSALLGRFISVDPLKDSYAYLTPYQYASNTPIQAIDLDGLERYHYKRTKDKDGKAVLTYFKTENFSEWTPTWDDWTKRTSNPHKEYLVHQTDRTTIEYFANVEFVEYDESVTYDCFEEAAQAKDADFANTTADWGYRLLKGLSNVAEESRAGHVGGGSFQVKHSLSGAKWAQKTFSKTFSEEGKFAFKTIDEVADLLKQGKLQASDVPIEYVVREGNVLIANTRSSIALTKAGIPRDKWKTINQTGVEAVEKRVTDQLNRNGLTSKGTNTVKNSKTGETYSNE